MATIDLVASGDGLVFTRGGRAGRGWRVLQDVVDGDERDQHERGHGVEQGHDDGDHVDQAAGDEPGPGGPVPLFRQRLIDALAVQCPLEDHGPADRHAEEHRRVQHHREPRVPFVFGEVARLGAGGPRDQHDKQQQHQVEEQQHPVDLRDRSDQGMMVDPDDADHEEADQVGQEGRPLLVQLLNQGTVPVPRHGQVEREQRDGHGEDAVAERLEPGPVHQPPNRQLAAGLGSTLARIWSTQSWIWRWRPGMSLLAKLSSMASTRSWPFRMSSCCLAISCRAIRVSWSAMARRSLAAWARLALTCSEIMMDSCGRFKMVSSSGHGVLSNPTMLPRKSQSTMPVVMPMNTYIEPQNLFTTSAIRSSRLVPRTCWDNTSLGL